MTESPRALPHRRHLLWALLLLPALALLPSPAPAATPYTLEQVRSYAFPEELVAAQRSEHVAWTTNDHGRRNVWVAAAPQFEPRQVTAYTHDDGQEISSLSLSADGQRVVYVRGGEHGANWNGGLPANPTSSPVATKVEIWSAPLTGGAPRVLAEGDDPVLSPDGRTVVFLKDNAAWTVPADGSAKARQLFTARGSVRSTVWSPDGKRLAFVSSRGTHAFIGIYSDDATPIRWLAPSTERDGYPRWSPDGKQVAFMRTAGSGGPPKPALQPEAWPWAIWVADAATGQAKQRWASTDALRDSHMGTLEWADGGRLVFGSYRDGWQHLYSLPAAGGEPLLLTPGNFMVEDFRLSPDRRSIVYNANTGSDPDDIDRRHLYRVPVDRAAPQALTSGQGLEWAPVMTPSGRVLFFSSTAQRPPLLASLGEGGRIRLLNPKAVPATFPLAAMVVPRRITFQAEDGVTVHGQLFEPVQAQGKRPAVVYIHGGPQRQMLLGWHPMGYYSNDYAMNQYLASRGYVVLSVNYRLGPGYGYDFHHPEAAGSSGASEYRDIRAAGRYLQSLDTVDGQRLGVYGGSYGGFLTAMALAHDSALFKVGVDIHGVHDWVTQYDVKDLLVRSRYEPVPDAQQALDTGWKSSPVSAVATWKSPVLFIHGDDDRNVLVSQTIDLVQRLKGTGVHQESLILVDETHSIQRYDNVLKMNRAVAEFLERYLDR